MSEQTAVASCCITGPPDCCRRPAVADPADIHEGDPLGNFHVVHGLRTYVSTPSGQQAQGKQNVVVFISDIFGVDLVNTKLLADEWAGAGWKVLVPDFLEGDAVGHEHLKAIVPNVRDKAKLSLVDKASNAAESAAALGPWVIKHREAVAKPIITQYFDALRAEPTTGKIVAVGFCWGARYALLMAQQPSKVDVVIANHPAFVVDADVQTVQAPVAFLKGDQDDMCTDDALHGFAAIARKNLGDEKVLLKIYPNAVHGFAVRGDDMVESERSQKEDAARVGIDFAKRFL